MDRDRVANRQETALVQGAGPSRLAGLYEHTFVKGRMVQLAFDCGRTAAVARLASARRKRMLRANFMHANPLALSRQRGSVLPAPSTERE